MVVLAQVSVIRAESKSRGTAWIAKHQEIRDQAGLVQSVSWSSGRTLRGVGLVGAERPRDLIDLAWQVVTSKASDENLCQQIADRYVVDISQCGARKPWSDRIRSITTSSELFAFSRQRTLIPRELYTVMGWRHVVLTSLSTSAQKDLVAESMAVPSVALCLVCLLTSMPSFWSSL